LGLTDYLAGAILDSSKRTTEQDEMKDSILVALMVVFDYSVYVGAPIAGVFAFFYGFEVANPFVAVVWAFTAFILIAYVGDMILQELIEWYWKS
jgi:hypothetical protein